MCQFQNGISEHVLKFRRCVRFILFDQLSGFLVELSGGVPGCLVYFRLFESFSFDRDTMQKFRTFYIFQISQYLDEVVYVMAVHGTEVPETKSLEQVTLA